VVGLSRELVRACIQGVAEYVNTLTPGRFDALRLYVVDGLSPKEIERRIGVRRGVLSGMLQRLTEKCGGRRSLALRVAKRLLARAEAPSG